VNIIEELDGILKGNRVVWMKPTRLSPACKYSFAPKAQKTLSACGMWLSAYAKESALSEETIKRDSIEKCPLCRTGRKAQAPVVNREST
jgi:hypothetical protein